MVSEPSAFGESWVESPEGRGRSARARVRENHTRLVEHRCIYALTQPHNEIFERVMLVSGCGRELTEIRQRQQLEPRSGLCPCRSDGALGRLTGAIKLISAPRNTGFEKKQLRQVNSFAEVVHDVERLA